MKKFLLLLSMFVMVASFANEVPISNLNDYFEYLPKAVHSKWTPYEANKDYEVWVEFRVKRNGQISEPKVVKSTEERANVSALNAVKFAAPYKPLPDSYHGDSVNTQVQLQYMKANHVR